ncbi:hypothetical protein [Campylobacter ureolyticus]|uniref:hypothetical protein n=1 Tax=Campylobacter ureolyticus TaxID=827 RepID=UPI00046A9A50|nr:hypothetical protein [Campylobacter ureolyticus]
MSMYPPVIIEVEKEIIDDLSDFLAEYKVIDTLDIIEKFIDIFNGKFKEIDELIEKYKNDEVLYIIYVWDTIYAKAWEVINKE